MFSLFRRAHIGQSKQPALRRSRGQRRLAAKPKLEFLESRTLLDAGTFDPMAGDPDPLTSDLVDGKDVPTLDAVLQRDGKIVVVGTGYVNPNHGSALTRYLPAGAVDPSCGTAGSVTATPTAGNPGGQGPAPQPDGKLTGGGGVREAGYEVVR